MRARLFLTIVLLQISSLLCGAADEAPLTLAEKKIPREEVRQQVLLGLRESRYDYAFKAAPVATLLFAECFDEGKLTRRFRLTSAMHSEKPEFAKGILSVGWLPRFGELTVLNDNGFGLPGVWVSRVDLPREVFPDLSFMVYAERPEAEKRPGTPDMPHGFPVYPLIGLVCQSDDKVRGLTGMPSLSTVADFLLVAASEHRRRCIVIYLYISESGGDPPLHFDQP